ncbi:MAG TPA: secretin N-terminal domain-containing protein, partial [Gemmataceae bacterium]|nr:secretin N-terminal domain-containing protein [Gemmataceae bacterium]
MRVRNFRGSLWTAILALIPLTLSSALALDPPGRGKGGNPDDPPPVPAKKAETAVKPLEKVDEKPLPTYAFEMRDKSWNSVFEWLTDQTGIPVVSNYKPTGTFNFIGPKGMKYTLPEIIDHLNDALLSQPPSNRYILIRREKNFTLVPAEDKVPIELLPEIEIQDLNKHGLTEMGTVVLALKSLVAEDVAPQVKQLKGTFGEVTAFPGSNKLVLTDTVKNLKRLIKTLTDMDTGDGNVETFSHKCEFIKARDAERSLKELLGDPEKLLRASQPQQPAFGGGFGGNFGGFPGAPGGGDGGGGGRQRGNQPAAAPAAKVRMHYITVDERNNTVLVTGPADKIAQARDIMKRIDVKIPGQSPILIGVPRFETYTVPGGNAADMAKALKEMYKETSTLRISAAGANTIIVYATPDDQAEIGAQIKGGKTSKTEVISVGSLDSGKITATLQKIFPDKSGGPIIEEDATRNVIIVHGTPDQVADIKAAMKAIGETDFGGGTTQVISLDKGNAASLAEAMQKLLPQMRPNPVKVNIPGSDVEKKPEEAPKKDREKKEPTDKKDVNKWDAKESLRQRVKARSEGTELVAMQLSDPQDPKQTQKQPQPQGSPITLTPIGNKLVITSDDPQALAAAMSIARLLMQTPPGGDFEIIKLKNASATEAAKVLDEAFNGPKQTPQQGGFGGPFGGRGGFNPFGPQQAAPVATPSANAVRIVADPTSNSLLVRASPLEMVQIRRIIRDSIDSNDTDSKAVMKTFTIKLEFADATNVATTLKDVFRENLSTDAANPSAAGGRFRGPLAFAFAQNQRVNPDGSPKGVSLSIGVDEQNNSLILNCTEAMHDDIVKLVKDIEKGAKDTTRTVKIIKTPGIDPTILATALDAIQGRTSNNNMNRNGFGGNGFNGNRGGGFGGGGFGGGGFGGGGPGFNRPGLGGGGGGGFNGGGGGRRNNRQPDRGPDFFAQAVMDDPQASVLYDPQESQDDDRSSVAGRMASDRTMNN